MVPGRFARLDFARGRLEDSFDSEADVERGGVTIYSAMPCSVETTNDNNQTIQGDTIPTAGFVVAFGLGYSLEMGDQVRERGRVLEVIQVVTPKSYEVRHTALCVKVG